MNRLDMGRRQVLRGAALASAGTVLPVWAGPARADQGGAADLALFGGQVLTLDRRFRIAEAVAIRDGRVVWVGGNGSVRPAAGTG